MILNGGQYDKGVSMSDQIGERIASLEAEFKSFRHEMLKDTAYIRGKVDDIADSLSQKVDRPYCQERHEKLGDRVSELEKNGKHIELLKRIRRLEQKVPVIVQQVVLAVMTAILTATAIKALP